MLKRNLVYIFFICTIAYLPLSATDDSPLYLQHSDTYEFIRGIDRDTVFITGSVAFKRGAGTLLADTAIWTRGESIVLIGNVYVQDSLYQLSAHRVVYDINNNSADAVGDTVIIISEVDSVLAKGTNAYYDRDSSIFRMWDRPTVFLNFQDSSRLIQVDADRIALDSEGKIGYADGEVIIRQSDTESRSNQALMYLDDDILLLLGEPVALRRESEIKGDTLILYAEHGSLKRIHVFGNGEGNFKEPSNKDSSVYDISELKASEIEFNLNKKVLENIIASGQAYSHYRPGVKSGSENVENNVSGDTIKLFMEDERLVLVQVIGGAEGEYLTGKYQSKDTIAIYVEDTVKYVSDYIHYAIDDSIIILTGNASVESKTVFLSAHRIRYNTSRELVTAFDDSIQVDTATAYIPVVLRDGSEEIIGSYLEYSMETKKGMIRQSKSDYQNAYYGGKELFREKKDIYYVDAGTYTSCDHEQPHFHFWSKNMKLIQNDKLIARPVVFYIEKVPLMIFPYYVFSTKPGRHSGFLSFKLGNFERGQRYISNVGYYWAASEYWDLMAALDYYEDYGLTYRGTIRYNWRYRLSGSISGSYANESRYVNYEELKTKRWRMSFGHSQTISPTFSIRANGTFLSDKSYYTDYSTDLDDRLNRNLRSQVSVSKRWGKASLSAQFVHDVDLDKESRTDRLPTATLSLPSRPIFGSPSKGESGKASRRWYHNFYVNYRVGLNNYSNRTTDTSGLRSRKEFLTLDHHSSFSASFALSNYLRLNPSFRYQETWYKIFETDQSLEKDIDASELYRRYAYSASVSASTDLYGTIHPNIFGLEGLRHVVTPSVSFSWAPEITRLDDIRSYTGAGGGGSKQKTMSFSLRQLFQAKVKSGEQSRKIDLLSIGSSASYNFEAEGKKLSNLSTSIHTSLLRNINLSANMVHDLHEPDTDKVRWWSPSLLSFSISTRFHTRGILGEYRSAGSEGTLSSIYDRTVTKQSWSLAVSHHYSESGKGQYFQKRHTINFNARLNLTPSLDVNYTQNYDIGRDKTVSRRIEISKKLHCWDGHFYWVPDGSNKGYYFRLNVISIPDIKFEKSESGVRGAFF